MRRRPRLLFLGQTLPYPPDNGVQIRTYNVMRLLARQFDITALCFYRWKKGAVQRDVGASVAALGNLGDVEAFGIPQEHSPFRFLWDHLRSVALRRVYTTFVYDSQAFKSRLRDVLDASSFDLAHIDSLDLASYLPWLGGMPTVCVHHNVESVLLRRRAQVEQTPWRGRYLSYQAMLTERQERRWCGRVALNVTVSDMDKAVLERLAPEGRFTVVPNGVDTNEFRPNSGRDDGLVFVGASTWFPNRDALDYFSSSILPLIRTHEGEIRVRWVGWASEADQERYSNEHGVDFTGYVEDIRPYVTDAACYVVPLRVGGGTRLKILYAWAMGKAVVSTSIGCEGLAANDGENILIRDAPEDFAEAVLSIIHDRELRERLGAAGRATVEQLYGWDAIAKPMLEQYTQLLGRPYDVEIAAK